MGEPFVHDGGVDVDAQTDSSGRDPDRAGAVHSGVGRADTGRARRRRACGRGCNLPEPFPCPVARILELTVDPATINPGESARITWSAENPTNITLSPGVGRVEARGTMRVSPSATTTYTLRTEGGPNGEVVTRTVTLVVRGTQPVAAAETTGPRPIPRMPDGKPDLQGVWFGGGFGLSASPRESLSSSHEAHAEARPRERASRS